MQQAYREEITLDSQESVFHALERLFFPSYEKKNENTGIVLTVVLLLCIAGLSALLILVYRSSPAAITPSLADIIAPEPTATPTPIPFPYVPLQQAYEQMSVIHTMQADFSSVSRVRTVSGFENKEYVMEIQVAGSMRGSTQGAPIFVEMQVGQLATGQFVHVGMALAQDGSMYIKRPDVPWQRREISYYPRMYENFPLDASTFGFNFVETFFTPSNALVRAIQHEGIQETSIVQEGRPVLQYAGILDVPEYLQLLEGDSTISPETVQNTRKTLQEARVVLLLTVDPTTQTIMQISVDADNLLQVDGTQAEELAYESTYDVDMQAVFSRFHAPVEELVPADL